MTITVSVQFPTKTAECTDFLNTSVVDQCSESVKTHDLVEHIKHCKLHVHVCCNSCTYCDLLRALQKTPYIEQD